MKRKRLLAAVMAAVMASTLTMSMPVTGYAMDQGTETVASEPEESDSSDVAVTNPEQDAESVAESTTESDVVSESQGKDPDVASVAESKEAKSGAMAVPDAQSNTVGAAEDNGAASAGMVGAAETKTSGNFEYKVKDNGTVSITKYTGNETNVTIPETIAGKKVTSIGAYAFYECSSLKEITIPDSVTSIGYHAFYGCEALTQIALPNSVTSIGAYAFYECSSLKEITIPSGVTSIETNTFDGCSSLQQITIPDGVTSIGFRAFYGCEALQQITIPDSVTSIGHGAFAGCTSLEEVTIPKGASFAEPDIGGDPDVGGQGVFQDCTSLQEVTIPDSVTDLGWQTFKGCISLQKVTIPDSVTDLGFQTFKGCTSLVQFEIQDSVTCLGTGVFSDCESLQQITIPDSVTSIGGDAFSGCSSLKEITIPSGVTSIGSGAFSDCTSLRKITIPDSVTDIGGFYRDDLGYSHEGAFANCSALQEITIPDGVTSIEDDTFDGCEALQQITIPDSVTSIGWNAFGGCSSLKGITIPDGVTSIGGYAFDGCKALQEITIPDSVTSIGEYAFSGCKSIRQITIPHGVTRIEWGTFYDCLSLSQITIPDSVNSIGREAFSTCMSLQKITIPSNVASIGREAFSLCGVNKEFKIYFYGDAPKNIGANIINSDAIICVLKGKSGWTVPTWNGYKTAYFTPGDENKPASTPTPVPTATPTPVPTQEASDIDTTKDDPDYTQTFEDLMTGTGTMYSVKWLTKNENFPHFSFVYEHDQKIGTYITATITNLLYKEDFEGWEDMAFKGAISQKEARDIILALMDQYASESNTLQAEKEAYALAGKIVDGFLKYKKLHRDLKTYKDLDEFFKPDTIAKKLITGEYKDLYYMYHLAGYKDNDEIKNLLDDYQKSDEYSELLSKALTGLVTVWDLSEDASELTQQVYEYRVLSNENKFYIEFLKYIRDNVKYPIVKDAASDILNVLTTEANNQKQKIISTYYTKDEGLKWGGKAVAKGIEMICSANKKRGDFAPELFRKAYKLPKKFCNIVFGTKNYQEKYDNMRVLAYLGDAIGQWTLENYVSYFKTSDITQKNDYARKSYYGLRLLLKTREDGEEALQGLWKGIGKHHFKKSQLYRVSVAVSGALKKKETLLFTADRDKAFYATAAACPVDVEVYNAAGEKALTIKNGQEIPFTTSGDILYTEYQNPGSGEYDKIVILPKDAGYTLKYVGTGLGTMILHTMDANTEMTTEKYLQNIPITSSTVVEMKDSSGNSGTLTLTTGKDSQKTTMELRPLESTYVPVTSLTFPSENLKLKEGESSLVTVKVGPENATDQSITWTSASDSIATVSADGVVTGKSAGTTTLTASAEDGKVTKKLTITVTKKENSGKSQESRSMYRLYNPNSGEHFYTSNQGERDHLVSLGWRYEGVAWNAPLTGAPIFRLYNPNAGDHHYTGSEKERDDLVKLGWKYEGVAWYTAPSTTKKPQYRLYNPNCTGAGAHHYTGSTEERDGLVKLGWRYEGIAWYGV